MKRIPLIGLVLLFISCNNSGDQPSSKKDSSDSSSKTVMLAQSGGASMQPVDVKKYLVPNADADKMIRFVHGCAFGCKKDIFIVDSNKAAYAELQRLYPPPAKIEPVEVRYKDDDDMLRYCVARSSANPARCKVKKFKNYIYKITYQVRTDKVLTDQILYYDTMSICPPPEGSDGRCADQFFPDSTKDHSDSTKKH